MLLVPPSDASPSYKISASLNLNPFLPISVITKVEMILSETEQEELQFVGEFEYVTGFFALPTHISSTFT